MEKRYYKNLKLIVCVGKDNLIGDRTPDENSNGMLWHIKEELIYFKNKTIGNTVLFGGTTAKYVPIELMKKNREVIILHRNMDIPKLIEDLALQNKTIFIAGGYSIYKYFLDNFEIDEIFFSKIKINNFKSIFDFKPDDVEIINYRYGEKVSYEVAI